MLSPRDDDDDDSHLCIKCNATVVGLENYIKHRKQRCGKIIKSGPSKADISSIDTLDPTYSLGADVFFQSLELQSSVKKTSLSRLTPPIPISKAVLDPKNALVEVSTSRDLPRMSPLESNLREEDWIGGHSLRIGGNEDNQTKLINAVASISGSVKKDNPSSSYSITVFNDFKGDEDFDESEESDEDEEEEAHSSGEKWKLPPNYTGGKWPPVSPDNEDWDEQEEGEWKPIIVDVIGRDDDDDDAPPPGHTKGKWVPGHDKTQIMQTTIQMKGSVQYWCGPCNRRLGSRAIYEKHLMSSLHMKKVLPEHELEFSGHLEPIRSLDKRPSRPSRFMDESMYVRPHKKVEKPKVKIAIQIEKKKRKRNPTFVHCSGCKSRVRTHLMGKHLISHYHFRKATDIKSKAYQQLILDNIEAIVHQSPFQCSPCKFYTNWLSNFTQHWFSEEHENKMALLEGRYWCSFCKFDCETSQEMLQHITGSDHSEVVAVLNRSMPIIIRKKTIFKCGTCGLEFKYNMEVKRHCNKTGHNLTSTAEDGYQELHRCQYCTAKFKSSVSLAAHLKSKHQKKEFVCLLCSLTFSTALEAKQHRNSTEHRTRKKEILRDKGLPVKNLSKKCSYCTGNVVLKNIVELKAHMQTVHPEIKKRCPKCGMAFTLFQEVSCHVKSNACQFKGTHTSTKDAAVVWNCSKCLFNTDSQAECYFHEVLHDPATTECQKVVAGGKEIIVEKYQCPLCPKSFIKRSLRQHLRQHTFERPYKCPKCAANFTTLSSLSNHHKNSHSRLSKKNPQCKQVVPVQHALSDTYMCAKCPKSFNNRRALSLHSCAGEAQVESTDDGRRRCPHDGCGYVAATIAHLVRHRKHQHGDNIKPFGCILCPFRTNTQTNLTRHTRSHIGVKSYCCPHCPFTCTNLENLRKHVLTNGKHRGKFLYHCKLCGFPTNTATDMRAHLTGAHGELYDYKSAVQAVKVLLMKEDEIVLETDNTKI